MQKKSFKRTRERDSKKKDTAARRRSQTVSQMREIAIKHFKTIEQ